ncbi:gliding motility-associated ABC transporter substrate-binding protein GldG [Flavobacterium litorale]|uniref:Gliding motility-associated ABC transporter substrate-binding protein GldG n=1 Tax=Flavobacterium litorale TaxID=2856519 RepID=A0ABX8V9Z1_9FLAO|nr:gliding motility-associated ABC transporter substrate-binding protein GldG [Flavobacterium litorale]QYJ68008.1 gliding motility-associated ABC transporter substrate-binding protein GldG [Flavobacterium litorale]
MKTGKKNSIKQLIITVIVLLLLNFVGNYYFERFDLTHDKRYTLSPTTLSLVDSVEEPLYIDVFLEGEFPGEFKRLQDETRQLLQEFEAYNPNIIFQFVNPLEDEESNQQIIEEFYQNGLTPVSVTVDDKGKQTQEMVFPWAIASYGDKGAKIQLLKNQMGATTAEKVISSVQHLEYAFADALNKVTKAKEKKIAIVKGNGEMHDLLMADFLQQVRENYYIAPFTLDSVADNPEKTLTDLKEYDLAVIAKPTERFTEEEKEVLDQYIVNGGKTLWMVDAVQIDMDSLYNETGTTLAFPRDLNLADMFFKYGFRINADIIKDEQATPIQLATGSEGSGTQYQQYLWRYSPFVYPDPTVYQGANHPIVKNLGGIKFEFTNPIDTIQNGINKKVLLTTSKYSKPIGTPIEVELGMVAEQTTPQDYEGFGFIPVAVLLEGKFTSMYENRILPFKNKTYKTTGNEGKMIVIADGDIVKNQLDKNYQPLELGYDKWTKNRYDNKEFLINCVNYLLDDNGLINIRSKDVDLPLLDKQKVYDNYTTAQFITVGLPLLIVLIFGILFTYLRKRKYTK